MSWAAPDPAARAVGMPPPITGPVVRIETDGGVEFDFSRDVIGDDIVFDGVAYSRCEYRVDGDGLTRLSAQERDRLWEADRAAEQRGVDGDGRWEIGWEPARATFFARHETDLGRVTRWFGSGHGTYPSVGALEHQLGFVLPPAAREWLNEQACTAPGSRSTAACGVTEEDRRPPDVAERPGPHHRVRVPGRPDVSYEVALGDERDLRAGTADPRPDTSSAWRRVGTPEAWAVDDSELEL